MTQAQTLARMPAPAPMNVMAITSGKGGVGKTNIAVNLAVSMADQGRNVVLLDADLGLANVDITLGLKPKYDLSHVISGERSLEEIVVAGPRGISIVPASSGISSMTNLSATQQAGLIRSFGELSIPVDTLIVDTGAGIDLNVQAFSSACQTVVVVLCDEPTSITDAYALIKVLNSRCGIKRFELLANMVDSDHQGRALYGKVCRVSDRFLDVHLGYLGAIPRDNYLRKAVQQQGPVVQLYPRSPSAQAFSKLAAHLGRELAGRGDCGGLGFFVERLIQGGGAESGA